MPAGLHSSLYGLRCPLFHLFTGARLSQNLLYHLSRPRETGWIHLLSGSERPEDIDAIFEVNLQAFGQDGEARLVNALREDGDYDHELSLVAVSGDRIIGHILFPPITIVSDTAETAALALAPLAVHQDFQCLGIGAALIEEGLKECQRLGHRIVIVVGHPTYYPKFGFTIARDFGIHAPFPCPDESLHGAAADERCTGRYFTAPSGTPLRSMPPVPIPRR